MKLGIGSYTYTWAIGVPAYPFGGKKMTAVDLVRKAAEIGVEVVQICDNLPLHTLSREQLEELKETAKELGITLEVGTRGVEPQHLRTYLLIAKYLGSNILRVILHKAEGLLSIDEAAGYLQEVLPNCKGSQTYQRGRCGNPCLENEGWNALQCRTLLCFKG